MTEQEYADEADEHFVRTGFTERELAHKIYRFGNVATVFSSYEGKETSTGKLLSRGVNIYQLYFDGKRWWISSVSRGVWLVASFGFRTYLHFFNNYSVSYGSLGAVMILLIWLYVAGLAYLIGGEINAQIEDSPSD